MAAGSLIALPVPTPLGTFLAHYSRRGLAALEFPGGRTSRVSQTATVPARVRLWQEQTRQALAAMLAGRAPGRVPPLDLAGGTPFQRRVWAALRRLRPGRTCSYAALARAVARPGAARAVGRACAANPIPLLVPCHRVLAADGGLGGFSAGLRWKRLLLAREGTRWREDRRRRASGRVGP